MIKTVVNLLTAILCMSCIVERRIERPNILLIITDDQGYADYGAYGGSKDVYTPNMDKIADEGVRFTNAYATAPVCDASRQGIITGVYQERWGTYYYGGNIFPVSQKTLPEMLKLEGYRCIKIGKTHYADILDNNQEIKDPMSYREFPLNHGYEEFLGFCAHRHDYFRLTEEDNWVLDSEDDRMSQYGPLWRNNQQEDFDGYTTDVFGDEAVKQIYHSDERPFFIELAFNAVHHPIYQVPDRYLKRFGIEKFPDWEPAKESFMEYHARNCWRGQEDPVGRLRYLANLACLDDNIGKVLDALNASGKKENTLIFFISDNGGSQNTYANNGILYGHKYILKEGGIRTVFTMCWGEKLSGKTVINTPVSHLDILPTCLSAFDSPILDTLDVDGVDLLSLLTDPTKEHHKVLVWDTGNEWAVRKGKWKIHVVKKDNHFRTINIDAGIYLYNLEEDPGERNNLADINKAKLEELRREYENWKAKIR
ncbi:sulfatase-like hydrolase/transferase [Carboxylicivirga sediminis]|uniref:Sulfatase-like hydrolase/transferase n=1 Tax=Carboxylicivirga sediminis TaxID=2006564 RepID=A0A941F7C5_9BACT|nr:sulfatase-like hydrolase/transferase [Carboxylicivirga sediminis]MBR8536660.1 sulfatase-like hydrolase/transferase [Carboxylicivirga sediminis]